jgi:hypothetical protein
MVGAAVGARSGHRHAGGGQGVDGELGGLGAAVRLAGFQDDVGRLMVEGQPQRAGLAGDGAAQPAGDPGGGVCV